MKTTTLSTEESNPAWPIDLHQLVEMAMMRGRLEQPNVAFDRERFRQRLTDSLLEQTKIGVMERVAYPDRAIRFVRLPAPRLRSSAERKKLKRLGIFKLTVAAYRHGSKGLKWAGTHEDLPLPPPRQATPEDVKRLSEAIVARHTREKESLRKKSLGQHHQEVVSPPDVGAIASRHCERRAKVRTLERVIYADGQIFYGAVPPLKARPVEQQEELRQLGLFEIVAALELSDPQAEAALHAGVFDDLPLPPPRHATGVESQEHATEAADAEAPWEERLYKDYLRQPIKVAVQQLQLGDTEDVRAAVEFLLRPEHGLVILDYKGLLEAKRMVTDAPTPDDIERAFEIRMASGGFDGDAIESMERRLRAASGQVEAIALRILKTLMSFTRNGPKEILREHRGPKS